MPDFSDHPTERHFLACCLSRPAYSVELGIEERDFTTPLSAYTFKAFRACADLSIPKADCGIMVTELLSEKIGPAPDYYRQYLALIADPLNVFVMPYMAPYYAQALKVMTVKREMTDAIVEANLAASGYASRPLEEILEDYHHRATVARSRLSTGKDTHDINEVYESYQTHRRSQGAAICTGFPQIDNRLSRIGTGEVFVFAARTGVGKSMFALNWIANILHSDSDFGIYFLSLEMPEHLIYERLRQMCGPDRNAMHSKLQLLAVKDVGSLTVDEIPELVDDANKKLLGPVKIVILDYFQALKYSKPNASGYENTSDNAKALKRLAKDTDTLVVSLSQLSRAGQPWEPVTMNMLRDTGVIEEAADYLIGAWRPDLDPGSSSPMAPPSVRMHILKDRVTGEARPPDLIFGFDPRTLRYIDGETL